MSEHLEAVGDHVVIELDPPDAETSGGIVIPEAAKGKPRTGKIISVGTDISQDCYGQKLDEGLRVAIRPHSHCELIVDEKKFGVVRKDDILCLLGDLKVTVEFGE